MRTDLVPLPVDERLTLTRRPARCPRTPVGESEPERADPG